MVNGRVVALCYSNSSPTCASDVNWLAEKKLGKPMYIVNGKVVENHTWTGNGFGRVSLFSKRSDRPTYSVMISSVENLRKLQVLR